MHGPDSVVAVARSSLTGIHSKINLCGEIQIHADVIPTKLICPSGSLPWSPKHNVHLMTESSDAQVLVHWPVSMALAARADAAQL